MAYLDRDGVQIWYESAGSGPVVLLSHGYSNTGAMWAPQIDPLASTHRVITWDMRGHGRSDSPEDQAAYSLAATIADMAAILDAAGADRAVIGGQSLGGYVSLAFLLEHPERVAALLLVDTGPGFRNDEARGRWNAQAEKTALRLEEQGLESMGRSPSAQAAGYGLHRSALGLARASRGMSSQEDGRVIESLTSVSVPTLVVVGSEDKAFLGATDYMAAKIPGAVKVVLAGAGHAANLDKPAEFNATVAAFLSRLPAL